MPTHFAFLRAINVSGSNIIRMEDLRTMLGEIKGVGNVTTYIQSGNVRFESKESDCSKLEEILERNIFQATGLTIPTFIRTWNEMDTIVQDNPFADESLDKETVLYTAFFREPLEKGQIGILESLSYEAETFLGKGREAYILVKKPLVSKQIFTNQFLEKKLKASCTSRNWNTVLAVLK